jgi:hypothetical protein
MVLAAQASRSSIGCFAPAALAFAREKCVLPPSLIRFAFDDRGAQSSHGKPRAIFSQLMHILLESAGRLPESRFAAGMKK